MTTNMAGVWSIAVLGYLVRRPHIVRTVETIDNADSSSTMTEISNYYELVQRRQ
jgi:hypothetical protein